MLSASCGIDEIVDRWDSVWKKRDIAEPSADHFYKSDLFIYVPMSNFANNVGWS